MEHTCGRLQHQMEITAARGRRQQPKRLQIITGIFKAILLTNNWICTLIETNCLPQIEFRDHIAMDDVLEYHSFDTTFNETNFRGNHYIYTAKLLPKYFYISSTQNKNVCTVYVYIFPAINNLV